MREWLALCLLLACAADALLVREAWRERRPAALVAIVDYPRLLHDFAGATAGPSTMAYVDGITRQGGRFDVLTERAIPEGAPLLVARYASLGPLWTAYLSRLAERRYAEYREEFRRYLVARVSSAPPPSRPLRIEAYGVEAPAALRDGEGTRTVLFSHQFADR